MYLSGARTTSDLWNNQSAYNGSTTKQFNGKAVWDFDWGRLTGFADTSRTSQADYFYLSKSELARGLGWDWGGYAPDWQRAIGKAYCNAGTLNAKLCDKSGADTDADGAFTAGQILRDDDLYYLAGDFFPSDSVTIHAQVYHHEDAGEGHNWNSGTYSYPGTPRQLPIIFRNTLYYDQPLRRDPLRRVGYRQPAHRRRRLVRAQRLQRLALQQLCQRTARPERTHRHHAGPWRFRAAYGMEYAAGVPAGHDPLPRRCAHRRRRREEPARHIASHGAAWRRRAADQADVEQPVRQRQAEREQGPAAAVRRTLQDRRRPGGFLPASRRTSRCSRVASSSARRR